MVYGLWRALPGAPGFLATIALGIASTGLTPASGCQDHTSSPSASSALVSSTASVHRIPPRVRDDRETPPSVGRDAKQIRLIWVRSQARVTKIRSAAAAANWHDGQIAGSVEPTGRANARPMIGSAIPITHTNGLKD